MVIGGSPPWPCYSMGMIVLNPVAVRKYPFYDSPDDEVDWEFVIVVDDINRLLCPHSSWSYTIPFN